MKRYEGLFILETAGKEEGIKEAIDKISSEITSAGGKVETVQKMDKRNFTRVADKKHSAGFYVNVIFESEPAVVNQLKHRFAMNPEVFRVLFTSAPTAKAVAV
jgi:ribosomal protein S6